jgi:hypothetical protein
LWRPGIRIRDSESAIAMTPLPGTSPTKTDLSNLDRSWISEELAGQALIRRVDAATGADLVCRKFGDNCAGLIFPYVWPGEDRVREYRLRRDVPDIRYEGTIRKEVGKYLSPPGCANMIYFAPGTLPAWLQDPDLPIVITEGEKKALALSRLSFHEISEAAECGRFLALGLGGVWNFRGNIGKETGPNGERQNIKGVIPDFGRIKWGGRRVTILFDANVKTNERVKAARRDLARHLVQECGAQVFLADLPTRDGVNGIDDYIAAFGPVMGLAVIDKAKEVKIKEKQPPQVAVIGRICESVEFFHTADQKLYGTFAIDDCRQTWTIKSQGFRSFLVKRFYTEENKPPSAQAVQDALSMCEAKALFDGPIAAVGTRLMKHEGALYLDLCDEKWRAAEVTATGWRVSGDHPARFRRARGMSSLPHPLQGGSLEELRMFLNFGEEDNWRLLVSWVLGAFMPNGPYPILILQGDHGSAKSTTARVLRMLIDPASAPLRSLPKDERDLMIAASNSWVLSFDNLSGKLKWVSDALCRLATGGGFATRELHSDGEETIFDAQRPVILNGIDDIATNPDLADRALIITLPTIPESGRRPEAEFWAKFEEVRPRIIGTLLDAVSAGLRNLDQVQLNRYPRMADFAKWVVACTQALPFSGTQFLDAYFDNRRQAVAFSIEGSQVATAVTRLLKGKTDWKGSATELLDQLNANTPEDLRRSSGWPRDSRAMSNQLRRVSPLLREIGFRVDHHRQGKERHRIITIAK